MLEHADRARPLANDPRDLLRAQIAQHAEQHHLHLVTWQRRRDQSERPVRAKRGECFLFSVPNTAGLCENIWGRGHDVLAGALASKVHDSTPGDRERPCAEPVLVASEAQQATGYIKPRIGR
jgi:hypothetical protein